MAKRNQITKVLFRYCNDMEHIIVHRNGIVLHDGYEGFPRLTAEQILECLENCGVIELEKEEIIDEDF